MKDVFNAVREYPHKAIDAAASISIVLSTFLAAGLAIAHVPPPFMLIPAILLTTAAGAMVVSEEARLAKIKAGPQP